MTKEEILRMNPGAELNVIVAKEVMGIIAHDSFGSPVAAEFSTDIKAAWEVAEKMLSIGWTFRLEFLPSRTWKARFGRPNISSAEFQNSAPEAICKAALIAIMEDSAYA